MTEQARKKNAAISRPFAIPFAPVAVVAVVLAAALPAAMPARAGDIYGLVIGIDQYEHITNLHGAVNDAADVARTLEELNARNVILLTDGDVTREKIFSSWRSLTEQAGAGDTLVFHYAGHGARQDAIVPGHEDTDNMFLLAGFDESGPGVNERIIDNEIGHLLAEEKEATVVFVADSCFAGGMTRDVDPRTDVSLRVADVRIDPKGDTVAERVKSLGEVNDAELSRVIWLYAQDRNKVTQEIRIGDKPRGALSYAFSRALEGEADSDGNSVLDTSELKRYVNRAVTQYSERRQRPEVNAGSRDLGIGLNEDAAPPPPPQGLPELTLYGNGPDAFSSLRGIRLVDSKAEADLIVDSETGSLLYKTGDLVATLAENPSAADLQMAVDKWRFIGFLSGFVSPNGPELALSNGSRSYTEGERVAFSILSPDKENVVLFNIASNGAVQLVSPVRGGGKGLAAGKLLANREEKFRSKVIPPFGADHLVAITSDSYRSDIVDAVKTAEASGDLTALVADLGSILKDKTVALDWVGLYSRAKGD